MQVTALAIDELLRGIEAGDLAGDVFTDDVVLDATVPDWRFTARGREQVTAELRGWFADPGSFETVRREPLPDGELVEFTLHWVEDGTPHACHQAHILRIRDGKISADTAFCGGRWPASLLARMAAEG
jgi:ketosteroid isomerase-like protein